jgi:hypothetical protein
MRYIKKYERFVEGTQVAPSKPVVKPDTDTPTRTRPSRPGVVPGQRPSEEDAPLAKLKQPGKEASVEDVYERLVDLVGIEEIKKLIK